MELIQAVEARLYVCGISRFPDDADGRISKEHVLKWCMYYSPGAAASDKLVNCPVNNESTP